MDGQAPPVDRDQPRVVEPLVVSAPDFPIGASAVERAQDEIRPIIPVDWRWLTGIYLGVPLLLVLLRPELWPNDASGVVRHYAVTVLATLGIGGLVHFVYAWPMPRLLPRISSRLLRLPAHALAITASVMLGKVLVRPLIHTLCASELRPHGGHEVVVAVAAAMVVVAAASTYNQLRQRALRVERLEAEARQVALSARLEALRARTNPHFLFNSLNTVASLIATDPACAEETLERLSDLFRYTLQSARRSHVKLADELNVVRDYLDIEQLRLGKRLHYVIDVDPDLEGLRVPPLILQPLVENAVLHGISTKRGGGEVRVSAHRDEDEIVLQVHDHGAEPTARAHVGTGTALADLQRRMELAFGAAANMTRERTDGGYSVSLRLPIEAPV